MLVAFSKSYFQVQEYLIIVHKKKTFKQPVPESGKLEQGY